MEQHLGRKLARNEVVHYINGNKKDNRIDNLEVVKLSEHSRNHRIGGKMTQQSKLLIAEAQNEMNKTMVGRHAKLSIDDVRVIRERLKNGDKVSDIARDYSVRRQTIYRIRHGESWANF
jgi:hypothetical protein